MESIPGMHSLLSSVPGRLKINPYQLVPLKRALEMSRVRLLLADAVGLGKTIEAGIILAELLARKRAHRILIVTPAGVLLEQWKTEMQERFGLGFFTLNRESLQKLRFENESGINPFSVVSIGIISMDFAK